MIVRWLGAFRSSPSLMEALDWEMKNSSAEIAAEEFLYGNGAIRHARVGLLINKENVVRRFPGDVWSERGTNGRLIPTRHSFSVPGRHTEVFCKPGKFSAIVLKEHYSRLKKEIQEAVYTASEKYNLPIVYINNRGIIKTIKGKRR